jgi:hypothetical protein
VIRHESAASGDKRHESILSFFWPTLLAIEVAHDNLVVAKLRRKNCGSCRCLDALLRILTTATAPPARRRRRRHIHGKPPAVLEKLLEQRRRLLPIMIVLSIDDQRAQLAAFLHRRLGGGNRY